MEAISYTVNRMAVRVRGVRVFQADYEKAAPLLPLDEVQALVASGAPWSEMVELIDAHAPYGFLIYSETTSTR
jgi:hypothetical protein